jgi:hypothetical protein
LSRWPNCTKNHRRNQASKVLKARKFDFCQTNPIMSLVINNLTLFGIPNSSQFQAKRSQLEANSSQF